MTKINLDYQKLKPTVYYSGVAWICCYNKSLGTFVAYLESIENHPRLGNALDVRTSWIVDFDLDTGVIETKNTIYKPVLCPNSHEAINATDEAIHFFGK